MKYLLFLLLAGACAPADSLDYREHMRFHQEIESALVARNLDSYVSMCRAHAEHAGWDAADISGIGGHGWFKCIAAPDVAGYLDSTRAAIQPD